MAIRKTTRKRSTFAKAKTTVAKKVESSNEISQENIYSLISETAYGLFEKRGYGHGNDECDWYEAEQIVLKSSK